MLLPLPLIGRHVEVREGHLEDSVGYPVLVVLGNIDNPEVPSDHERDWYDHSYDRVDQGVDGGGGEGGLTPRLTHTVYILSPIIIIAAQSVSQSVSRSVFNYFLI